MKCNLPFERAWSQLPKREREIIEQVKNEEAKKMANAELAETQEIWIKLSCIILRDYFKLTEEELQAYILAWKRIYRANERIETKAEQTAWLESEMSRCFPEHGFPQRVIDNLKQKGQ